MLFVHTTIRNFIVDYQEEHGYPPTYLEITKYMGWASKSTTAYHLVKMRERGLIAWTDRHPRTLRVL